MAGDVAATIIKIIADQAVLQPDDISIDQKLDDIGIDSMGLVEAIFAIEEAFGIEIPFNANQPMQGEFKLDSVGSVIAAVEALVAAKAT